MPYVSERVRSALPGAWLFVNARTQEFYSESKLRRVWEKMKTDAGIGGLRLCDATRHSFASQLANSGVSIFEVSRLMGHSDVRRTEKYAHPDLGRMMTTIQRLSLNKVVEMPKKDDTTGHELAVEMKVGKSGQ